MIARLRVYAGALALVLLAACSTWQAQPLPQPVSRPDPGAGFLRAGFSTVDITPPPGIGLGGTGPEDRRSTGYRTRLHARVMVLQDADGERIALVVTDMPHVSANIHRLVAGLLVQSTGIGADRLIISATHTHSSFSAFYGERQYNTNASRVTGFDPRIVDYVVRLIARAVEQAAGSMRRVRVNWGTTSIVGATTNRSFSAFCRNPEYKGTICVDSVMVRDSAVLHSVDTTLFMLRVDDFADRQPIGSYSVFAIHGTAVPSLNTLYDGDVHVRIVQRLTARTPGAVNILANGTEGDVAPNIGERIPACDVPRLGITEPVLMPIGPAEEFDFIEPPLRKRAACIRNALDTLETPVSQVAMAAHRLFERLGQDMKPSIAIRRAYATVWLPGNDGLCPAPVEGSSTAAGAEGMTTRVTGWVWVPILPPLLSLKIAAVEGAAARHNQPGDCQSPKRTLLGAFQSHLVVGEHGLPEVAQLTVVRLADLATDSTRRRPAVLLSVPAEITSVAGRQMTDAVRTVLMRRDADSAGMTVRIIGLANGFLQYVTTADEYKDQSYEGGSDLYGPNTAGFLARRLAELAGTLPAAPTAASPIVEVGPITAYPGPPSAIMASPTEGPRSVKDDTVRLSCAGRELSGSWYDLAPGRLFPNQHALIEIYERTESGPVTRVGEDGDSRVEVRPDQFRRDHGYRWTMGWRGAQSGRSYQLRRVYPDSAKNRVSEWEKCAS